MKYIAIFPVLLALISLILSFLCIFAGSKTGYLESYDLVTVNTSRIAVDLFKNEASSGGKGSDSGNGFFGSAADALGDEFDHLKGEVESGIDHVLNDASASFATVLGLHDFYSIHVLDFCEGFFSTPGSSQKNVTGCSNTQSFFTFDPSKTLERELKASGLDLTLDDLQWPSAIDESVAALKVAFNIMFVLYCIAIFATALSFWASLAGIFLDRRMVVLANIFLAQLAFGTLMIASAIVTGAANQMTDVINDYGEAIDVTATKGDNLIRLTWVASLLMLFASFVWLADFLLARRKAKKLSLKEMQ